MRQHFFKTSDLLFRVMAAVIDDYIEARHSLSH